MYTATTPTITLSFAKTEIDLTDVSNIYVTFSKMVNRTILLEKSEMTYTEDDDNYYVTVELEQAETLLMEKNVLVQVNFIFADGTRVCSAIERVSFKSNLHNEVIATV